MDLLIDFIFYLISGITLVAIGTIIFLYTTKIKELKLIAAGNLAAGFLLGGRVLGLAIVIRSAISNSVNLIDMIIWGSVAIVAQILLFLLVEILTPHFHVSEAIEKENHAVGFLLMILSISIGVIISGCLTY